MRRLVISKAAAFMHKTYDTNYEVETPEAINLSAQVAGPAPRILAYTIDISIRMLLLFVLSIVLALFGSAGWGGFLIFAFLFEWFYPVFFEVLRGGQTPGKRILKIAVVNDDLTPVTWSTSIIRNLLRAVDILPFAYVIGLVGMTCTRYFQRLGDLAAGSIVIHQREASKDLSLPMVQPQAVPQTLTLDDQLAIASFAQRHDQISQSRQEELANIMEPLTGKQQKEGVAYLHGMGAWLLGQRK